MRRFYLVPKIGDGLSPFTAKRAKYLSIDGGPIAPGSVTHDFPQTDLMLIEADLDIARHLDLTRMVDVTEVAERNRDRLSERLAVVGIMLSATGDIQINMIDVSRRSVIVFGQRKVKRVR